jgi:hypothetical protein
VKDLNKLGRDLQKVIIVDNSPASYIFHPDNAVSIHIPKDRITLLYLAIPLHYFSVIYILFVLKHRMPPCSCIHGHLSHFASFV